MHPARRKIVVVLLRGHGVHDWRNRTIRRVNDHGVGTHSANDEILAAFDAARAAPVQTDTHFAAIKEFERASLDKGR